MTKYSTWTKSEPLIPILEVESESDELCSRVIRNFSKNLENFADFVHNF